MHLLVNRQGPSDKEPLKKIHISQETCYDPLCYTNINGMRLIPLMLSFIPCSSNYIILLHWFLSTLDGILWCYHSFPMFLSCCFNSLPLLLCFNHSFHLYFMCSHMLQTNTNGVRFISLMSSFIPSCINLCLPIL